MVHNTAVRKLFSLIVYPYFDFICSRDRGVVMKCLLLHCFERRQ